MTIIKQHVDKLGNPLSNGDFVVDIDDFTFGSMMCLYQVTDASESEEARIFTKRSRIIQYSKIEVLNELEDIFDGWTDTSDLIKVPEELADMNAEAVLATIKLFGMELVEGDFDYEALNKE